MVNDEDHGDDDDDNDSNVGLTHLFGKTNRPGMQLLLSTCSNTNSDGVPP